MENFTVSARKYRPDNFKSVVGQAAITSTLKNAIKNSQLGHAYLFSGPRGVGKTTCARIFAKTINCKNLSATIEACNECESCTSFNENRSYNIHELDAASNNSVDDIRSLTEQVRIPPQIGRYSLYIIDEVHMLSAQAFNAFLKTLEEPPAHAIFILATTEKHKIIPTILSRCQIYDFNRIKTEDTVEYLKYIAREESIFFEEDALHVIAQKAEGAMRDALSIFDQVVSFSEKNITYNSVIENLNVLNVEYYFKMSDDFLKNNLSGALMTFNEILNKGFDARNFIGGLASHMRDLLVSKNQETAILLDVGATQKDRYLKQAAEVPVEFLYEALEICNAADLQFRGSKNQRLTIELALVKLSNLTMVQKKKIADQESTPDLSSSAQSSPSPVEKLNEISQVEEIVAIQVPAPSAGEVKKDGNPPEIYMGAPPSETEKNPNGNGRENQTVYTKSISIKGLIKGAAHEIPLADDEIEETDYVTQDLAPDDTPVEITEGDMQKAWDDYARSMEKIHPRISSTLQQQKPRMKEPGKIQIHLNSNAQRENFVQNIKPGLTRYFQEKLGNIEYAFETNLIENETTVKKVYTDHDKLEYMIKKNKDLETFKTRFNLDFDD